MNEFSEAPVKSGIKQVLIKTGQMARKALEAMDPVPPVPKERINSQVTAQRILEQIGSPVSETFQKGTYWRIPFSLRTVLAALGYVPLLITSNHFDVFPQECQATGKALQALVNDGALEIVPQEKADRYNQRAYWRVIDEAKLKEIAQAKPTAKP